MFYNKVPFADDMTYMLYRLGLLLTMKSPTPGVLTDSGVEDAGMADDVALVPAETLCELLRRAYRLARDRFAQYEEIVATQMEKKSPQKVQYWF